MTNLQEVVDKLLQALRGVSAVILFGSRARGDHKPWSDYDLLIIANFDEPYLERIKHLIDLLKDVKIPIEPHPYTLEEALSMLKRGNPTLIDALEEGIILYKGPGFTLIEEAYIRIKPKLRRTVTTIELIDYNND